MARAPRRLFAFVAAAVLLAALAPSAASAATLKIRAPSEIDHTQKFRVVTKGDAKARKDYFLSLIYHNDDQGDCGVNVYDELNTKVTYVIFYQYPVTTDADGKFTLRSRRIFGGVEVTGKFCAYLMNPAGATRATAVRPIAFS